MKRLSFFYLCLSLAACSNSRQLLTAYKPVDAALYHTIAAQDSIFFAAYNTCDLETQARYYADTIEFYHDKGGLMTDKNEILASTKKYVCGRTSRELLKGSIEVYPIQDFGAVEMGQHIFRNSEEPNASVHASKFIIFWRHRDGGWQMTKVVSLH